MLSKYLLLRANGCCWIAVMLAACSGGSHGTPGVVVVKNQLPIGTTIDAKKLPGAPTKEVLMVLADCSSCSLQVLKLTRRPKELKSYVLTADPKLVPSFNKEWPDFQVVADPDHRILPSYCYAITPQIFLAQEGQILDEAVGSIQCASKWDEWNQ